MDGQVSGMRKPVTILSICDTVAHPNYFLKSNRVIFRCWKSFSRNKGRESTMVTITTSIVSQYQYKL